MSDLPRAAPTPLAAPFPGARFLALLLLTPAACATATFPGARAGQAAATAEACRQLEGTWEGKLPTRKASGAEAGELMLRVVIGGPAPRVFVAHGPAWGEAKEGAWEQRCLGPSAVLHAIDSARDGDGEWVESWVVALTRNDEEELLAHWSRMVHNVQMPLENPSARFANGATGGLKRRRGAPDAACPVEPAEPQTPIGEYLEKVCGCGGAQACGFLAMILEREGTTASRTQARALRARACSLGHTQDCGDTPPPVGASPGPGRP